MKNENGKIMPGISVSSILCLNTFLIYICFLCVEFKIPNKVINLQEIWSNWHNNYIDEVFLSNKLCKFYGDDYFQIDNLELGKFTNDFFTICYRRSRNNYINVLASREAPLNTTESCPRKDSLKNIFKTTNCINHDPQIILENSIIIMNISSDNFLIGLTIIDKLLNGTQNNQIGTLEVLSKKEKKFIDNYYIYSNNYYGLNKTCFKTDFNVESLNKYHSIEKSYGIYKELIKGVCQFILLAGAILFALKTLIKKEVIEYNNTIEKFMVFYMFFLFFLLFMVMMVILHYFIKNLRLLNYLSYGINNRCYDDIIIKDLIEHSLFFNDNIFWCIMIIILCFLAILLVFYELKQLIIIMYKSTSSDQNPNGYSDYYYN